ncbi:MAG: MFS transporter [Opitutaceae bacterium]|nr:MFS transporter [Opitutaceae bacterium]
MLSVSAPAIAEEIHLSDRDLGRLFFAFLFAYGLAQLFVGPLLERFRAVPAYATAVVAWSLMGAGSALATGFMGLFAARLLLGIFEAPNWPLALRVTARIFPPPQRSLAIGIFQSGSSIGALVAPPIIIWLTQHWGWRTAFVACGGAGIVWAILWVGVVRGPGVKAMDHPTPPDLPPLPHPPERPDTFRTILGSRAFWGLVIATSLMNPLQYMYTSWLPRYLTSYAGVEFGRDLATRLMLAYLALDMGLWLGGGATTWLARLVGVARARLLVAGSGTVGMGVIPLVASSGNIDTITTLICVSMFGLGCFIVNYLSFVTEVSATRVALVAGLLGGIGSLLGAGFMLVVGSNVQSTRSFDFTFLIAGVMPVLAFAGLYLSASANGRLRGDHRIAEGRAP